MLTKTEGMSMKRLTALLLVLLLLTPNTVSYAARITSETESIDLGKVIEVIDGEVLKVFFYRRNFELPSIEQVRVIGLNTEASNEAFEYASSRLLGKTVFFMYDDAFGLSDEGMTLAHVFMDYDETYAEEVLSLGYGVVDASFKGNAFEQELMAAQYSAELYEIGRWETSLSQSTDRININTASRTLLEDALGLTNDQIVDVIAYREQNKFNDIFEVMAVDYKLDSEWFDEHSHLMSVVTNINKTSYLELSSLMPESVHRELVIDDLDHYLKFNEVVALTQLHEVRSFSGYLTSLEPYLTLEASNVLEEPDKKMANVNTVGEANFLLVTGLTKFSYSKLVDMRDEGEYVITSLADLYKKGDIYSKGTAHIHNNRLTTLTDVNKSGVFELETVLDATDLSLYERQTLAKKIVEDGPFYSNEDFALTTGTSVYREIEPYVYVYQATTVDRYNPNTPEEDALESLEAKYNGRTTNYTNVNVVSKEVLLDLNEGMTVALVNDMIEYRTRYPFRDNNDLWQIFDANDKLALYNSIAYYLSYE